MPRLPRKNPDPFASPDGQRLAEFTQKAPDQVARLSRITAGWPEDDPRWDDLVAAFDYHSREVREYQAGRIRKHADEVKRFLLDGEWTGLRMAADLLHLRKD
jgi:hypothetical protein